MEKYGNFSYHCDRYLSIQNHPFRQLFRLPELLKIINNWRKLPLHILLMTSFCGFLFFSFLRFEFILSQHFHIYLEYKKILRIIYFFNIRIKHLNKKSSSWESFIFILWMNSKLYKTAWAIFKIIFFQQSREMEKNYIYIRVVRFVKRRTTNW